MPHPRIPLPHLMSPRRVMMVLQGPPRIVGLFRLVALTGLGFKGNPGSRRPYSSVG